MKQSRRYSKSKTRPEQGAAALFAAACFLFGSLAHAAPESVASRFALAPRSNFESLKSLQKHSFLTQLLRDPKTGLLRTQFNEPSTLRPWTKVDRAQFFKVTPETATEERAILFAELLRFRDKHWMPQRDSVLLADAAGGLADIILENPAAATERLALTLAEFLTDKDPEVRSFGSNALPKVFRSNRASATERVAELLTGVLKNEDPDIRPQGVDPLTAVFEANDQTATEERALLLIELLEGNDPAVRRPAGNALTTLFQTNRNAATERVNARLLELRRSADPRVRFFAARALTAALDPAGLMPQTPLDNSRTFSQA